MGHGIGLEFALAGYDVVFHDASRGTLRAVNDRIHHNLAELVEWCLDDDAQVEPTLDRIETTADLEAAGE